MPEILGSAESFRQWQVFAPQSLDVQVLMKQFCQCNSLDKETKYNLSHVLSTLTVA